MKKRNNWWIWIVLIVIVIVIILGIYFFKFKSPCLLVPSIPVFHDDYYTNAREDCFYETAINNKDPTQCEYLKNSNYDSCMRSVAKESQNADLCDKIIQTVGWRENCITDVAVVKNDSSICNKISNYVKDSCLKLVSNVYLCRDGKCYTRH
jgi:hypothetical protein